MAALQTEILADSPVAYLKLDETSGTSAADASGNAHPGTHASVTVNAASLRADNVGKAVTYTGAGQTTLDTLGTLGTNYLTSTWEFLIKTTATTGPIAVFGVVSTGSTMIVSVALNSSADVFSSGITEFTVRDNLGNQRRATINTNIYDGNPHHVVFQVASSTSFLAWVDGVAQTVTYTQTATLSTGANFTHSMMVGARSLRGVADRFLTNSTVDEWACYATRLSSTRVGVHATAARVVSSSAIGQGTATATANTLSVAKFSPVGQGTATADGSSVSSVITGPLVRSVGQGTATASGSAVSSVVQSAVSKTTAVGQGTATASGGRAFSRVFDASTRLAIPASGESGFMQAAQLYDGVGLNTHFIYIDTPYSDRARVIERIGELGVRHIREGIIASWFDARYNAERLALAAIHARNQDLPAGQQPIFVLGGTSEFPPQQTHPYTVAEWMATMDGGHVHYNGDVNSTIPGAIPGVGGPLTDAQMPYADPEAPWLVFSGLQSSNEPQGDTSQIPAWQAEIRDQKLDRTTRTVYEGLPYTTPNGVQLTAATVDALPVVGSVSIFGSGSAWPDMSTGTGYVDVGDLHTYMGGSNPSFEHVENELFNAQMYNGRLKTPADYPASSLPFFMTETGYITSGNDSAHFPVPHDVQAKYLLTSLLINAKLGIRRTFIYELYDEADLPTVSERNFGMIEADDTPKDAFYALRNYLSLTGFSEAPAPNQAALPYSITGFTAGPDNFQTRIADGTQYDQNRDLIEDVCVQQDAYRYVIWVWRQINLWDREAQEYTTPDTQTLTLNLPGVDVASVSIATPTDGGTVDPEQGRGWQDIPVVSNTATFTITGEPRALQVNVRAPAQNEETMASFTFNRVDLFPPGTSVGLYTQLNPATQIPMGPLNQSQTVAGDGTVTFSNLSGGITYYAFAYVNSVPVHVSFLAEETSGGGGGGIIEETDPTAVKLVPVSGQAIVPNADVPALTVKSYSASAPGSSMFEARDASASDALRLKIVKEGTLESRPVNAFFPSVTTFLNPADTQPSFRLKGSQFEFGAGGSVAPDMTVQRVTNAAGAPRLKAAGITIVDSPVINVVEYGAVGDNSTDNTAAFNAAFVAANPSNSSFAGGATVYVPPGVYRMSAAASIRPNTTVQGAGRTSILRASGNTFCLTFNTGYRSRVTNMGFDAVTAQSAGGGIDFKSCLGQVRVDHIHSGDNLFTAFDAAIDNRSDFFFDHIYFNSLTTGAMVGVNGCTNGFLIGGGATQTNQVWISNVSGTALRQTGAMTWWLVCRRVDTLNLTDVMFVGGTGGIWMAPSSSAFPNTSPKLNGVTLDFMGSFMYLFESSQNMVCTNCNAQSLGAAFGSPTSPMVYFKGTGTANDGCSWNGGIVQHSPSVGAFKVEGDGVSIRDTTIRDINYGGAGTTPAISTAAAGVDGLTVTGNEFSAIGNSVACINVASGSNRYIVSNNRRRANVTGTIFNDAGGAVTKTVSGNI